MRQPAIPKRTPEDEGAIGKLKAAWSKDVAREIAENDCEILNIVDNLGGCVNFLSTITGSRC